MKNIKRIIVILIIASTSLSLAAQSTFGIVGGLNLSKFNISKTDGLEYEFGPGFDAGLFFRFQAGKHFYIQPDVIYSIKTTDMIISNPTLFMSDSNQAEVITHKMHSIDVPVHIGLVFGKKTNFRIFAGPRFGFAVNDNLNAYISDLKSSNYAMAAQAGIGLDALFFTVDFLYDYTLNKGFTSYRNAILTSSLNPHIGTFKIMFGFKML